MEETKNNMVIEFIGFLLSILAMLESGQTDRAIKVIRETLERYK